MRKRIMAVVLAAVLTLAMGTSVFAAGSNGAGVTTPTAGVTVKALTNASEAPALTDSAVQVLVTAAGISEANAVVLTTFELDGTVPADGTVVLNIASMTAGTKVVVLHKPSGSSEWQKEEAEAGNGTLTIKNLKSFSPFAIIVDKTTVSSTSPKTGEASTVAVVSIIALAACSVAFFARKKRA